jgi:hypothetical protein
MSPKTNVAFAVGTGRSGTHFVAELFRHVPSVAVSHERYPLAEAFERYCAWYGLPVDREGFLRQMEQGVSQDLRSFALSIESSAYLSLSIGPLYERFGAKFIVPIRRPDQVVNSYWGKGWYLDRYVQGDPALALGYQGGRRPHHTFSRLAPRGPEFLEWQGMTRIGRLSWFWAALNQAILEQLESLPESHYRIFRLEDFDYAAFCDLSAFLGLDVSLSADSYQAIVRRRPGKKRQIYRVSDWTMEDRKQFEAQVRPLADRFDYICDTESLVAAESSARRDDTSRSLSLSAITDPIRRILGSLRGR